MTKEQAIGYSFIALVVLFLSAYALGAWVMGRLFAKADIPSWKAWVPVYGNWKLLEMGGQRGWITLIALIPYVGIVAVPFFYIAAYHIGKRFGKSGWFVLMAIFLPLVWMGWLAFDGSRWKSKSQLEKVYKYFTSTATKVLKK